MESPRVCVIHSSPAVRETLAIILSDGYVVDCLSPEEFRRDPSTGLRCAAVIIGDDFVGDDFVPAGTGSSFPADTQVLWLHAGDTPPPLASTPWTTLSPTFEPHELRATLHTLLTGGTTHRSIPPVRFPIDYPVFPEDAVALARRAARTTLPVLLSGAVGTGKTRLARAIHALGSGGRFVQLSASSGMQAGLVQAAGLGAGNLTLFVSDLAETTAENQHALRELLDCGGVQSARGWHPVRFICATAGSIDDLAQRPGLGKDLFYRLSVLPITLPRLRERAADIPALVAHLSAELTRGLSVPPVAFTPRAMERLERYLWFGNLAELEAVVTRSIALAQGDTIDRDDLLFGYGRLPGRQAEAERRAPAAPGPEPSSIETVDLVINELAHEFKNPMVMMKTVSQQLERWLEDDDGRQQVTRLTNEAVTRMDRTLDNLLQFTRFRAPVPERIALNSLLTACLTELTPLLTERRVLLDFPPADFAPVFGDAAQLAHAFENLLRVIIRDLEEGDTLTIRERGAPAAAVFEFTSRHRSTAGKLVAFLDRSHTGDEPEAPLGLVFARVLVERNGGQLEASSVGQQTTITVWLPGQAAPAGDDGKPASANGKTASAHS